MVRPLPPPPPPQLTRQRHMSVYSPPLLVTFPLLGPTPGRHSACLSSLGGCGEKFGMPPEVCAKLARAEQLPLQCLEGTYRITGTGQLDIFGRGQGHYMIASSATVGGQAHMPLCVSAGARFSHIRKASTE